MSATYAQVAAALKTALAATGFTVYEWPLANPAPPCHVLSPQPYNYDATMRSGSHHQEWTVRTLVGASDPRASIGTDLYAAMTPSGTTSVKAAIETDPTLGGVVDSVRVAGHDAPGFYDYSAGALLGVDFTVHVLP